jgi:hypothetical protein
MNETNLIALAKVIRATKRFDMGLILGRYDPETGDVLVQCEPVTAAEFWADETLVGDYTAWANALAEHEPLEDEDAAAAWLGLTIEQYDRLSYADHPQLERIWDQKYDEIAPEMAAVMLERIVKGEVQL